MAPTPTRRRFLASAGTAVATGWAGCAAPEADAADLDRRAAAQFRGGLRRHGDATAVSLPDDVEVAWRVGGINTGEHTAAKSSAVEAPSGALIVPGDTGTVSAITPTGRVRWTADTNPSTRGFHGTPAIANDTVYVGAYDGALYAFDLETGDRQWRTKLGDAIGSSPAYHDGTLYIPVEFYTPSGSLFAVNAATGRIEFEDARPTNHPHSTPAIDLDAGILVFGSNDGSLYAWEYPSLEFAWQYETGGAIKGPIATHDGSAFFGSWDQAVYRVALATGDLEWRYETGGLSMAAPGIDPATDEVFAGSHDGGVYAFDASTGDRRWRYATGGNVLGGVTVTRDHVLAGSYDRHLYAIERTSGELAWRVAATGWVTSSPLVTDDGVYFTDRATDEADGDLYKLAAAE